MAGGKHEIYTIFLLYVFLTCIFANAAENSTSRLLIQDSDVYMEVGKEKNITIEKTGLLDQKVTLFFVCKGDPVLRRLANISLGPGKEELNVTINLQAISAGHTTLVANVTPGVMDVANAFARVSVTESRSLDYLSDVVGWIYFAAWSISFYPQIYSNWRRRSVIGFHFDFLALNLVGFAMYSVFNLCLFFSHGIKTVYFSRHPYGVNPIQINDVIFAVHAFAACVVLVAQCCMYERGDQHVSKTAKGILGIIGLVTTVMVILSAALIVQWLDFLYYLSYVKLFITLIKYIPQAYYNYRRKSTSGWSIGNILLDFTGGILSIVQMFILAYNYNDWGSIFGDPTKFGLGLFSVFFDVFFMIQHYVLYRGNRDDLMRGNLLASPQLTTSSSLTDSVTSTDYGATSTSN